MWHETKCQQSWRMRSASQLDSKSSSKVARSRCCKHPDISEAEPLQRIGACQLTEVTVQIRRGTRVDNAQHRSALSAFHEEQRDRKRRALVPARAPRLAGLPGLPGRSQRAQGGGHQDREAPAVPESAKQSRKQRHRERGRRRQTAAMRCGLLRTRRLCQPRPKELPVMRSVEARTCHAISGTRGRRTKGR